MIFLLFIYTRDLYSMKIKNESLRLVMTEFMCALEKRSALVCI